MIHTFSGNMRRKYAEQALSSLQYHFCFVAVKDFMLAPSSLLPVSSGSEQLWASRGIICIYIHLSGNVDLKTIQALYQVSFVASCGEYPFFCLFGRVSGALQHKRL